MSGWRYGVRSSWLYMSVATDLNWFRIEVGPVSFTVARRHKAGRGR